MRDIYARLPQIVAEGLSLIIVEQDIAQALRRRQVASTACRKAASRSQGPARELTRETISAAYFGM